MGLKSAIKRFFDLEEEVTPLIEDNDDSAGYVEEKRPGPARNHKLEKKTNIVSLQSIHQQTKVILAEPKAFEDVENIVAHLKNRRTLVVNLHCVTPDVGRRILDFMSGTIFALDGQIRKIGKDTFLFAPEHVDISGMITDWIDERT
ncbi:cell division protein SepF [Terrilactibacillus sp. S3-3]|nr:cell division protein SepF [Terrilactibacillus sp. S3-3]